MKSIKLAALVSVMGLASGIVLASPEHAVTVNYQNYQEGANAQSNQQQNNDDQNLYRTINSHYGK